MIELKNIYKSFNINTASETKLFDNFDFAVKKGEFVSIVGSNGSGKTTLLNIIAGSVKEDSGKINVGGKDITGDKEFVRAKTMGRVFQNPSAGVAENMTVAENLSLAKNKGKPYNLTKALTKADMEVFKGLVSPLGLSLENKLNVPMGNLSGGQRQAASLIMATMTPIDILILDEHTAALDPKTADIIMELTDKIVREKGLTAIMVTHNLRYAVNYGSRLVMMHEGNVVLDVSGEEKKATGVDNLLGLFNTISIECGN